MEKQKSKVDVIISFEQRHFRVMSDLQVRSIKIDSINDHFKSFAIPLASLVPRWREKYKELIRIKFRQNDGFCECCDLRSIRNVATRDIRPPAEDDCNKTIIKCAQYATLTYVEDEARSIVYYETDVMSDSRSILFEYLFSNAQISASGLLRCGGVDTNEISWTSYDEKRDAELERIQNFTFTLRWLAQDISSSNAPKELTGVQKFRWQLEVFASIDDGVSWTSIGYTPTNIVGTVITYELLLPTYHYSGKGAVKYRIQQNTTACDCCDDLFVRYVLPNNGFDDDR